ncbi:MAG: AI-2E family transporter [Patescibacteria group bacterium]
MPSDERQMFDISTATIFRFVLIVLFFILLYQVRQVIFILLFAIVVASAVNPFAKWLDRKRIPRILGILVLYLTIFLLAVFILTLAIPFFSQEVGELTEDLPKFIAQITASLEAIKSETGSFDIISQLQGILDSLSQFLQESSQSAVGLIINIFGGIISFAGVIVISFYLSVMRGGIDHFLKSVVPDKYEKYTLDLWHRSERNLGRWFQAQLLLSLIVGLMTFVALSILGVKFALVLAGLIMVLELVPNVGPVLAAIPAVGLAFFQSPSLGFWTLGVYILIQQVENHVLTPLIMGKSLGINPVAVIIALLVGFNLAGIIGMILAVPVATVVVEWFNDIAEKKEKARAVGAT